MSINKADVPGLHWQTEVIPGTPRPACVFQCVFLFYGVLTVFSLRC
jgi:hypothetical protein